MKKHGGTYAIVIASLSFLSVVMVRFSIPSLLPYIISRGASTAMGGLIVSVLWVGYTIFQLVGGLIVDKYGYNTIIYVLVLIAMLNALYPSIINYYSILLIMQFTMGSLMAISYVALISMVLVNYSRGGLGAGIYQSMFFIGSSISIILSPYLFSINKYIPFILFSIIILFLVLPISRVPRPNRISGNIVIGPENARILGMGFIRFSAGFSYIGFLGWSTYFVVRILHVEPVYSGFFAFLSSIGGSVGSVLGGYVGDKFGYALPSILSALSLAITICFIARLMIIYVIIILMLLLGFLYGFYAAPSIAISKFAKGVGAASGFLNFMSQLGGSVSPYLIGFLLQYGGFDYALLIVGLVSIVSIIVGSTLLIRAV
nr:MAG: hypothetical protein TU36_02665 [Vulcanisaeta sp. AZ3]